MLKKFFFFLSVMIHLLFCDLLFLPNILKDPYHHLGLLYILLLLSLRQSSSIFPIDLFLFTIPHVDFLGNTHSVFKTKASSFYPLRPGWPSPPILPTCTPYSYLYCTPQCQLLRLGPLPGRINMNSNGVYELTNKQMNE